MAEYLRAECPQCKEALKVRQEYVGRRVECRRCNHTFEISRENLSISTTDQSFTPQSEAIESSESTNRLKSDNLRLREQRAALRVKLEVLQSKQESSHALKENLGALQAEIVGLKQELAFSQTEASRAVELKKEIGELQLSLTDSRGNADRALAMDQQLLDLHNELKTARTASTQLTDVERQNTTLSQELAEARSDAERGARAIQELETLRHEFEIASAQHASTSEESTRLSLEGEDLRRKLDDSRLAHEEKLTTARIEHEAAKRDWQAEKLSLEELAESRARQFSDATQTLQSKLNELNSVLVDSKSTYEDEKSTDVETIARMESENEKSQAALLSLEARLAHEIEEHTRTKFCQEQQINNRDEAIHAAEALSRSLESRVDTDEKEAMRLRARQEELLMKLDQERLFHADEVQAKDSLMAAVRADWGKERESWSAERNDLSTMSINYQQVSGEQIDQLRAAEERSGQLLEELRLVSAARDLREKDLQEIRVELAEMNVAVAKSQEMEKQIKLFLSGLGIRLPN